MNTPKISIIVPVYKVEKYLRRCLDSIVAQTFTDWECILIDDGSPDNSGKICDEYAEKDNRFRVFHQDSIPDEGMVTNLLREFESFDGYISVNRVLAPSFNEDVRNFILTHPSYSNTNGYYNRAVLHVKDIRSIAVVIDGAVLSVDVEVEARSRNIASHAGIFVRHNDKNIKTGNQVVIKNQSLGISADDILLDVRMSLLRIATLEEAKSVLNLEFQNRLSWLE